jgi:CheY-like chemotaxis protein
MNVERSGGDLPVQDKESGAARLLVVDDNPDTCESMKLLLERAGYDVAVAQNGARALDAQRARPASILITDIFMPEVDGLETISRFRREFPAVGIIAMTGGGMGFNRENYLLSADVAGADAVLRKPFEKGVLLQTLQDVMRRER